MSFPVVAERPGRVPPSGSLRGGQAALGSGPLLFARYAFGPNRLGLCGPEDWRALLELGAVALAADQEGRAAASDAVLRGRGQVDGRRDGRLQDVERGLRDLARGFEGAYPYLELISSASGIADPLDARVVDAYWIGSPLSDRVPAPEMTRSLEQRFRSRLRPETWRWLADKPAEGARPTHAFHVLDVFPRVGLMRGGQVDDAVALMDACRVRWGTVREIAGERLAVESRPLQLTEGRLVLGEVRLESVRRWLDGRGFLAEVAVGDTVSLHWDWACEVLSFERLRALRSRTVAQLRIANRTL